MLSPSLEEGRASGARRRGGEKMIRKIITIDRDKCNGCGLCADACHENAIAVVDGKAELIRDDYCDGLGNCLPACPTGAIAFEEREAAAYDDAAVKARQEELRREASKKDEEKSEPAGPVRMPIGGCPGSRMRDILKDRGTEEKPREEKADERGPAASKDSELAQWPVQIKLIPVEAPCFSGAHLLIAADCTAFSYGDFHRRFMKNRVTLIGCPKLDEGDYTEKLTEILRRNEIKSVMIVRMEVPCCGGIENAVKRALAASGKLIPWRVVVVTVDGRALEEQEV